MNLPPEVLKLLGDDATPEGAAKRHEEFAALCHRMGKFGPPSTAQGWWDYTLAAAAIRLAEADHAHNIACAGDGSQVGITQDALNEAQYAYRALRNWRKE